MDQVSEAVQDVGAFASEVVRAIKERPYTTMAYEELSPCCRRQCST